MDDDKTTMFKLSKTHQCLVFQNNLMFIIQTLIKIQNVPRDLIKSLRTFNFAAAHSPWLNLPLDSNPFRNQTYKGEPFPLPGAHALKGWR